MRHEVDDMIPRFTVEDTDLTFDTWLSKSYVNEKLTDQIKMANVLLVPMEQFGDIKGPMFPQETVDLYPFLLDQNESPMNVDICIREDEFVSLALHSALITLGTFVVTAVVAPIFVNVISQYIGKKVGTRAEDTAVDFEMFVVEGSRSKHVKYKGPAKEFGDHVMPAVSGLLQVGED